MRFAFMTFSCPKSSLDEVLELAGRFGYDGVEPRTGGNHRHGVEPDTGPVARRAIRDRAAAAGVEFACLGAGCRFADPAISAEQVEQAHACIDLAADVGAPRVRVFGGALPQGLSREGAIQQVAGALQSLADHAAERGVVLCMETHDDWCDPEHVAAVMRAVDHPAVGVNWDLMHPVRAAGRTMRQAFDSLRPWVRHCHVHDAGPDTSKFDWQPIGLGVIDHRAAMGLLRSAGYDGYLSGEWIGWEPPDVHLPRELAALRAIQREAAS